MAKARTERPSGLDKEQKLAKLDAAVAGLSSSLGTLDEQLGGVATMVAENRRGIDAVTERVETLEDWCAVKAASKALVNDFERDLDTLEGNVGKLMEKVDGVVGEVGLLSTRADKLDLRVDMLEHRTSDDCRILSGRVNAQKRLLRAALAMSAVALGIAVGVVISLCVGGF